MNEIEKILVKHGCDSETIAGLVNKLIKVLNQVADDKSSIQITIALAVLLKAVAAETSENADEQLAMIMELADCYHVNIHHND